MTPRTAPSAVILCAGPTRRRHGTATGLLATLLVLAGCASQKPPAAPPPSPLVPGVIAPDLPLPAGASAGVPADTPPMHWRDLVRDAKVQALVTQALANNRDLRVAILNVQRAQAQFQATDANRLPTLGVGVGASRAPDGRGGQSNTLTAGLQLSTWEIDLFGRLQGLSDAARAQWLASAAGQRAAELALVARVVAGALALQADDELLALTRRTLASREDTLRLALLREKAGATSRLEALAQRSLVAQAQAALAQAERQRAQDRNAMTLLVGQPLADDAWPSGPLQAQALAEVPVGLSSQVLLRRPDVLQAEQQLLAAQANVVAVRAAIWPTISLTAQAGQVSPQLSGLFIGGNFAYTLAANALLTVMDGGRRQANVAGALAGQQVALADYERVVQTAFRDTADALAGITTWRDQVAAQDAQVAAARETVRLTELRARQGAASDLERLDAQRSLLAAEQAAVQVRLAELNNRVALFKAVGGPAEL